MLSQKVKFMSLILKFVPIAVHVPKFVLQKQFIYDASLVNRVIEIEIGKLDEKHMAMEAIFLNHQKQKCK
jgi:hypothetical protein